MIEVGASFEAHGIRVDRLWPLFLLGVLPIRTFRDWFRDASAGSPSRAGGGTWARVNAVVLPYS